MRKSMCVILALTLIMTVTAACGQTVSSSSSQSSQAAPSMQVQPGSADADDIYPIHSDTTLTYWVNPNESHTANAPSFNDLPFYKALNEMTGINVEFMHPAAGQALEQLNLLIASNSLPDIIEHGWLLFPGGPSKAIKDGIIITLNDVIDSYAPNFKRYLSENPDIAKMIRTDEGSYYVFPLIREGTYSFFGPIVRSDWLKDLNLELPETMDDWHTMLTAFKEQKGASAPLTFQNAMNDTHLSGAFTGAYGSIKDFYLDKDGKVIYGSTQPGMKDFYATFAQWYKEGLIDPDIANIDYNTMSAKMTNGQSGATLGYTASRMGVWLASMSGDPTYDLAGAPYPVLNRGDIPEFALIEQRYTTDGSAAITTACKDVELAARLLDFAHSEAGHLLYNFGIEGESYTMVDGVPTYTDEVLHNKDGLSISQALGKYARSVATGPYLQSVEWYKQYYSLDQQKLANEIWSKTLRGNHQIPRITYLEDESLEYANIMNEVKTYVDEMYIKFIIGTESLDKWDEYVKHVEDLNIARAIEIMENALERYNNR